MKSAFWCILFTLFLIPTAEAQNIPSWAKPQDPGRSFGEKPKHKRPSQEAKSTRDGKGFNSRQTPEQNLPTSQNPTTNAGPGDVGQYCPAFPPKWWTLPVVSDWDSRVQDCKDKWRVRGDQSCICPCIFNKGITTDDCKDLFPKPSGVPVDDYLPLLAVLGIAFGVYRLYGI